MSEHGRRLVHVTGSVVPIAAILDRQLGFGIGWNGIREVLILVTIVSLVLEGLRLSGRLPPRVVARVFGPLTRDYERTNLAGYAIFLVGMTVAALVFPRRAAIPAMLMLAIADPISGVLSGGRLTKQGHVLLATFGVALLLALPFVPPLAAIAGAAGAAVADGYKPTIRSYVIDDNLTIPILAGALMTVALSLQHPPSLG